MKNIIELVKIWANLFEQRNLNRLNEFKEENEDFQIIYLKLQKYFAILLNRFDHHHYKTYKWIFYDPIEKTNDINEAFRLCIKQYKSFLHERNLQLQTSKISFDALAVNYYKGFNKVVTEFELDLISLIEKEHFEIKVEIIKNEAFVKEIQDGYEKAVDLYWKEEYEKAFQQARDVFQNDLEKNFNLSIKHFANKNDELSNHINSLLESISNIRNYFAKVKDFNSLSNNEKIAITKFSIEQLINIRNYLAILKYKMEQVELTV